MTLKQKIDAIINYDTSVDKSLLILGLLEDEGLGLYENGWLDDDHDTMMQADSDEVCNELDRIFS